jgi:hypothetical protein
MADYLKARTLTACVNGIGPSIGGIDGHYTITKFHMGHSPSLIDAPNNTVQATPLDTAIVEGLFYSKDLVAGDFQWSNGKLLVKCICPIYDAGSSTGIAAPKVFSTLFLEDSNGNLSHGVVKLPDTVLPETGSETWLYIEFPINTAI